MVARIKGPSQKVVVVGAGLAGLSAALRLAGVSAPRDAEKRAASDLRNTRHVSNMRLAT